MEIQEIKIKDCIAFKDNPFKIRDTLDMELLVESIAENGVLIPIVVRKAKLNQYEVISGQRRIYACQKAGIESIPAIVEELSRDESIIMLVDANLHMMIQRWRLSLIFYFIVVSVKVKCLPWRLMISTLKTTHYPSTKVMPLWIRKKLSKNQRHQRAKELLLYHYQLWIL